VADFLALGCTLGWNSLFRGVKLLPGGSLWCFTRDRCDQRRYFTAADWLTLPPLEPETFKAELEEALTRILPNYFEGEGPIGISLTGGLDTRMIMACRPPERQVVTYTFAGTEGETLDARLAARVAAACGLPHHLLRIGNDFFTDFASLADRTVSATDGALGVCGAHEIYLNRQARALALVRLTGNYGSEILRGMTTFKPLGLSPDLLAPGLRPNLLRSASSSAPATAEHPVVRAATEEIPWHLFGLFRAAQSQVSIRTPYLDNAVTSLAVRAPASSRTADPAVCIVRRSATGIDRIPTDQGLRPASPVLSALTSPFYRASFKIDYWHSDGMPRWLSFLHAHVPRLGAALSPLASHRYLHYRRWFQRPLYDYVRERLTDAQTLRLGFWNRTFLEGLAEQHAAGQRNGVQEINAVLTVEAIDRLLLKQSRQPGRQAFAGSMQSSAACHRP
jgi:asparagine synthase (glutamine-hydrolysing)